ADDRCARYVPHHAAMIDDPELDVSPLTVHELVTLTNPISLPERNDRDFHPGPAGQRRRAMGPIGE
ncbi:hypothetical protein ACFW9O_33520, partial [Streptomyces sp. NPDC059499]|uniref:hypothetical protein n=1 Tax=Streptomyces sp. NPDC059499 TaxID=3346852 RepID=UPI0036A922BD